MTVEYLMSKRLQRLTDSHSRCLATIFNAVVGWTTVGLLHAIRFIPRKSIAYTCRLLARTAGPFVPSHGIGRANLVAAFPEKAAAEIEQILVGVWDNLGRTAAEFAHIDRLTSSDPSLPNDDIVADSATSECFRHLRLDGKPALIFAAHLGNWELLALGAGRHELETAVLLPEPQHPRDRRRGRQDPRQHHWHSNSKWLLRSNQAAAHT
jgi:KDO2-lipid IV(A) lauroyltransferase